MGIRERQLALGLLRVAAATMVMVKRLTERVPMKKRKRIRARRQKMARLCW